MKIRVKQTHIRRGKQTKGDRCPIALAVSEVFKNTKINVGLSTINIGGAIFPLPKKAQKFIDSFDDKKSSVRPFEFEVKGKINGINLPLLL